MQRSVIIVAGGSGKRMGAPMPKQFMLLKGRPVLCWTIDAFHAFDAGMELVVVLPKDQVPIWRTLCIGHRFHVPHTVVSGGEERFHSVRNGLAGIEGQGIVAVHDGVRPLVGPELIGRCFAGAEEFGAAVPVVAVHPSLRETTTEGSRAVDRKLYRVVQTPQCFKADLLRKAFEQPYDAAFTDEATLVERLDAPVHLVDGEERNIKITTPLDLKFAEVLMER